MSSTAFIVLVGMIVCGVLLIVLGRRGWRFNDHPICRQCEFDLHGVYPGAITCPECGAGLKREGWVRIGARRRLWPLVVIGAILILAPLAPLGTFVYASATGTNLNKYKPLTLLLWEGKRASGKTAEGIADEVLDRYTNGKLDKDQKRAILETALEIQGDERKAWAESWGAVMEAAIGNGDADKAEGQRYYDSMAVLTLEARKRVRLGGPIPFVVNVKESRCGPQMQGIVMVGVKSASIGGKRIATEPRDVVAAGRARGIESLVRGFSGGYVPDAGRYPSQWLYTIGSRLGATWGQWKQQGVAWAMDPPKGLEAGTHELEVRLRLNAGPQAANTWNTFQKRKEEESRFVTLRARVEVVDKGSPVVEAIEPSEEITKKLADALVPTGAQVYGTGGNGADARWVTANFSMGKLPVPVCFDVYLQDESEEKKLGTISSGRGAVSGAGSAVYGAEQASVYGQAGRFKGGERDIVLRPNLKAAAKSVDLSRVYNGEVVIKGVDFQMYDTGIRSTGGLLQAATRALSKGQAAANKKKDKGGDKGKEEQQEGEKAEESKESAEVSKGDGDKKE